ncbi:MAG: NTP transferase domain-containing protein, partial [Muribaculaceae bacterium]|nr:NTP transferase domain-containing protein [Muribaculaceae bacterium]
DLSVVKTLLPIDAVLMAGGKGERLSALTLKPATPLLPVGGKAIIDYNIDELERCGVKHIFITTNYLAEKIEKHVSKRNGAAKVECFREPRRLGTMGSLALIEGLESDNVLLMNSDLLTSIDFEAMYLHHMRNKCDLTMAGVPYTVSVPYALMRISNGRVKGLEEKPTYNYFANAGVYILKRRLIDKVTKGEFLDAPDFISSLIDAGGKVGCYPIEGTWIDIGSPDDYRYANELMERRQGML